MRKIYVNTNRQGWDTVFIFSESGKGWVKNKEVYDCLRKGEEVKFRRSKRCSPELFRRFMDELPNIVTGAVISEEC